MAETTTRKLIMRTIIRWFLLLCLSTPAIAQQAPWARSDTPISSHDRVYTADQTSNTVSVIDPAENKLLGVIRLGDPVPGALSPLYKGQLLVHGLGYSPDSKTLAVVSVGSNSVTLIDTATNKVKGVVYVGRSPHEPFFTPNGRELWVTVRGENYVSVIDPARMKETRRIEAGQRSGHDHVRSGRQIRLCMFQLHTGDSPSSRWHRIRSLSGCRK